MSLVSSNIRGFPDENGNEKNDVGINRVGLLLSLANHAFAQDADKAIADAVIAMVKAQWTADIKDPTNVAAQSKDTSDDYTEFNADYATRIDGKAMSMRLAKAGAKGSEKRVAAEMGNPKVQDTTGTLPS